MKNTQNGKGVDVLMERLETKSERFVRLAEPRVSRACKAVSLLANLASSQYEYTEKQVDAMFAAIEEELTTARAAFKKGKDSRKFKF